MVDKPVDLSSLPPPSSPKIPEETKKTKELFLTNPFPNLNFTSSEITQETFIKKFWEEMEKSIGQAINKDLERMKRASAKLRKALEGKEED
jgi:hypothetical protein